MNASKCAVLRDGVTRLTGEQVASLDADDAEALEAIVDALGAESGVAQALKGPLTTLAKLRDAPAQRLYVLREGSAALGLLKVGPKHLYYWRKGGGTVELDPPCVLDFYVAAAAQRRGAGRRLFEAMLEAEGAGGACAFAYDRPSPKMLPFLRKHYGLGAFVEQPNNFVVFDSYFGADGGPARKSRCENRQDTHARVQGTV